MHAILLVISLAAPFDDVSAGAASWVNTATSNLNMSTYDVLNVGDLQLTSEVYWNLAARLASATDGTLLVTNAAGSAGVLVDFATDGTLKLRNRANNADADMTLRILTASNSIVSPFFAGTGDVADSGVFRIANGVGNGLCGESSPTGSDFCFYLDASEIWQFGNANFLGITTGGNVLASGGLQAGAGQSIYWNNSTVLQAASGAGNGKLKAGPFAFTTGVTLIFSTDKLTLRNFADSANGHFETGQFTSTGIMINTPTAVTIADSGGAGAAASTLTTPLSTNYRYTCSDADGCTLTLGETSVFDGQRIEIHNVGTNRVTVSDSSGVQETAQGRAVRLGQYDSIRFIYHSDRWHEAGSVESDGYYGSISGTAPLAYTADIVTQDVFIEALPTTAASSDNGSCFSQTANGKLLYGCPKTAVVHCHASVSYAPASGTAMLRARLTDNGTSVAGSEVRHTATAAAPESATLQSQLTLASGEYVSLALANGSNTTDFTIDTLNITCVAL